MDPVVEFRIDHILSGYDQIDCDYWEQIKNY